MRWWIPTTTSTISAGSPDRSSFSTPPMPLKGDGVGGVFQNGRKTSKGSPLPMTQEYAVSRIHSISPETKSTKRKSPQTPHSLKQVRACAVHVQRASVEYLSRSARIGTTSFPSGGSYVGAHRPCKSPFFGSSSGTDAVPRNPSFPGRCPRPLYSFSPPSHRSRHNSPLPVHRML